MSDEIASARADIEQTRAALAETTAALAVKADVKTRATAAVKQNQAVIAAAAGAVVLLIGVRLKAKRSKRTKGSKRR